MFLLKRKLPKSALLRVVLGFILQAPVIFASKNKYQILACKDTSIQGSHLDTYWKATVCPISNGICGADPLDNGTLRIVFDSTTGKYSMKVRITGVHPTVLYAVYFLPLGADPCNDKVFIGDFITNPLGKSRQLIRDCRSAANYSPDCVRTTGPVSDPHVMIPGSETGTFFIYSRGPWVNNAGEINTDDGTMSGNLRNPTLWGGANQFDGIQFVTGLL